MLFQRFVLLKEISFTPDQFRKLKLPLAVEAAPEDA